MIRHSPSILLLCVIFLVCLYSVDMSENIFPYYDDEDLDHEEAQALEEDSYIINSAPIRGKRKISGALLSPPETESSSSCSSSPAVSIRHKSGKVSADVSFELPSCAISSEALEFIGFKSEVANEIFARWVSRPNPANNPDDLTDYIYGHTVRLRHNIFQNCPPKQAMSELGLVPWFQNGIVDPYHSAIFATETLHFWVNDTLRINYMTLKMLRSRLKLRAVQSIARKNKSKRGKLEGVFQPAISSLEQELTDHHPPLTTLNVEPIIHGFPESWVAVQETMPILPDHYVLYKGKVASEVIGQD